MKNNTLTHSTRLIVTLALLTSIFSSVSIALASGTPEIDIMDEPNGVSITSGDTTPSTIDSTDFGDVVTTGSSSVYYDICNNGTANLHLTGAPLVELTGDADFTLTLSPPSSIVTVSNCTYFQITFTPGSTGIKNGAISIINDDSNENPYTFDITGNGVVPSPKIGITDDQNSTPIANGESTPSIDDGTDFGNVVINGTANSYFDICNSGTTDLHLTGSPLVQLSGDAGFSVTSDPSNIVSAGYNCTYFQITFAPLTTAVQNSEVSIASDDSSANPYTFAITGTGRAPTAQTIIVEDDWSLNAIANGDTTPSMDDNTDFGVVTTIASTHNYYDICNSGETDLNLTGTPLVQLTGSTDFSVTAAPQSIVTGSDCTTFTVTFAPTSAGIKTATVSIPNDVSSDNPFTFAIQGEGQVSTVGPDSYESDDDFASAKPILTEITQTHSIYPVGDSDIMSFTLNQPSGVVLKTGGPDSNADTIVELYDSKQNLITSDDDGGLGLYSLITRTCGVDELPAGTYYVQVNEYDDNDLIPSYTMSLTAQPCTTPQTITLNSTGAQDGWILESSELGNKGSTLNSLATTINLGDDTSKKQYRDILSFNTGAGLPDTAVITAITLKVKKQGSSGPGNPITTFQGFMLDIKKGIFGTKGLLQASDFQATASKSYGPFKPTLANGWYSFDLTNAKSYFNKLGTSSGLTQIRLRFKLDDNNNTVANMLRLYSGNAPTANRPQLIITYYIP